MTRSTALINAVVYSGDHTFDDRAVVIEDGLVTSLPKQMDTTRFDGEVIDLEGLLLAPGLIDLQVNGGGDRFFNDTPTVECLEEIAAAHVRQGTTDLLATYISGPDEGRRLALEAVRDCLRAGVEGIVGVHLEGPLINEERLGIHKREFVRAASADGLLDDVRTLASSVPTVVTLAPEVVPPGFVRRLGESGALAFAGHTEAPPEKIAAAIDEGLRGGTHVWNCMPPVTSRRPGPVVALLADPRVWCAFIADGQHLDPRTLSLSFAAGAPGRSMLVSDALPPVGGVRSTFELNGVRITDRAGRCEDPEGRLAGGGVPLLAGVRRCVAELGVELDEALRMATLYPAECLGIADRRGRIAAGYPAHLIVLDTDLSAVAVVVGDDFRSAELGQGRR